MYDRLTSPTTNFFAVSQCLAFVLVLCIRVSPNFTGLLNFEFSAVSCSNPQDGVQTVSVDASISYVFGDNYTYACNDGYKYNGAKDSTCKADGTWSLSPPTCAGDV